MNRRSEMLKLVTLGLLIAVIMSYQNCAQQMSATHQLQDELSVSDKGAMPLSAVGNDTVSVGDQTENNNSLALAFVERDKLIPLSQMSLRADGLCSSQQNGAVLYYALRDPSNNVLTDGFVQCQLSGFVVQIAFESPLNCTSTYKLEAQLGRGQKAEMNVRIDCSR